MTFSSSLASDRSPLILDTSVLINLHASGHGARILAAVPNDIIVPEAVALELNTETGKANGEAEFIDALIKAETVHHTSLSDAEYATFEQIVTGRNSLDDGEAATIAVAAARNALPVIDERKGRSVAKNLMLYRPPAWSIDLFTHPMVQYILGVEASREAVYLALKQGRMRIHEDHCDPIVAMIGRERALDCTCLPNFKMRFRRQSA